MRKVIILGLDGATFDLIRPWVEKGKLPNFGELMEKGTYGEMRSTFPPNTFPAWPSMFTGKNPGKHGVFEFTEVKKGKIKTNSSYDVKAKFVWEILEEKGHKCGIINIPSCSPFRSKVTFGEGDQLRKDWVNFSWPEDTKAGMIPSNPAFEERIKEIIGIRFRQLMHILKEKEWDFLALSIYVIDPLQHFRWHNKKSILEAYQKIDGGLGRLMKEMGDINLIIVSDHGMQTLDKWFYVNIWLKRNGFLSFKGERPKPPSYSKIINQENFQELINPWLSFIQKFRLQKFLPSWGKEIYRRISRKVPGSDRITTEEFLKKLDWEKTKAYCISSKGGISLNAKENYEEVRDEVKERLSKDLRERSYKVEIYEREEIYSGPYLERAPDLFLVINDFRVMPSSTYNLKNLIFNKPNKEKETTGQHSLYGIFMAYGPDIKEGKKIKGANIMDIAPTILHMFNLKIPKDMDGRVLKEIFKENSEISKRKVRYKEVSEKEKIKKKAKKLRKELKRL